MYCVKRWSSFCCFASICPIFLIYFIRSIDQIGITKGERTSRLARMNQSQSMVNSERTLLGFVEIGRKKTDRTTE